MTTEPSTQPCRALQRSLSVPSSLEPAEASCVVESSSRLDDGVLSLHLFWLSMSLTLFRSGRVPPEGINVLLDAV